MVVIPVFQIRFFGSALLWLAWVVPAWSGGVAVLKEQPFHRDLSAVPVAYQRIIDSRGPWLRIVTARGNVEIGRSKLAAWIEFPGPLPDRVMEEGDVAWFRGTLDLMERFAVRYPASARLLEAEVVSLRAQLARFDAGEVRVDGRWMTRGEHQALLDQQKALAEASRRREIDEVVRNEALEDEGMVRRNGEWVRGDDPDERSPVARTGLSDCLWPLLHPDAEGAKLALENLDGLIASRSGAAKVNAERLQTAIRGVFAAETLLARRLITSTATRAEATRHERSAAAWSKPNAFGTARDEEVEKSLVRAAELHQRAGAELDEARESLREQLRELDLLTADYFQQGEHRVALVLGETVRHIATRRFPDGSFEPTFPAESLEGIRAEMAEANGRGGGR